MQTDQMLLVAIPLFTLSMLIEAWLTNREKGKEEGQKGYEVRDTAASLAMGIGFLILAGVFKLALIPAYYWLYQYRLFDIEPGFGSWLILLVSQDFCFYWYHRFHHEVRFMWAGHVNHHSSQHYNLSTALRQSWTSFVTCVPFYAPLIFMGFSPVMLATVELTNLFYQFWIHTEVIDEIGHFEKVLNTASHHRVHHGSNEQYLDTNYGAIFIVWDKLFGTFQPEEEAVCYGLSKNIDTFNPVTIAFHEWTAMFKDMAKARSLGDALGYFFKEPGWEPMRAERAEGKDQESSASLSARAL